MFAYVFQITVPVISWRQSSKKRAVYVGSVRHGRSLRYPSTKPCSFDLRQRRCLGADPAFDFFGTGTNNGHRRRDGIAVDLITNLSAFRVLKKKSARAAKMDGSISNRLSRFLLSCDCDKSWHGSP